MMHPIDHAWAVLKEDKPDLRNIDPATGQPTAPSDDTDRDWGLTGDPINPGDYQQSKLADYGVELPESEKQKSPWYNRLQGLPSVLGQVGVGAGAGLFNTFYGTLRSQRKTAEGNLKDSMNIKP